VVRQTVIAFWLIPAEPARSLFQGIINDLARRFDAPVFEPHMTIDVGTDHADLAKKALEQVARECTEISLTPVGIGQSEEFVKTLFVQFESNAELRQMNELIRQSADDSLKYEVKPHLSLLYKKMEAAARRQLASSIIVPFAEITFDRIKTVRCVSPTESRADVEAWRLVAAIELSSFRAKRSGVEGSRGLT
jgi:2'-5' RNA ligase